MAYQAPTTKTTGEFITPAIWNQDVVENQNAAFPLGVAGWTAFTPSLTQSGAVSKTVTYAKYQRIGRLIVAQYLLAVTGSGTASNNVRVGFPVTAVSNPALIIGTGEIYDASANLLYRAIVEMVDGSTFGFLATNSTGAAELGTDTFTAALASGDRVTAMVTYEAAS